MQIFLTDNHLNTRLVKAKLLTENGDKEVSYRAGRLTHLGQSRMREYLLGEGRAYIRENIKGIENDVLRRRTGRMLSYSFFEYVLPVLLADRDGSFDMPADVFKLLENEDSAEFVQKCADAAIELNPLINMERAAELEQTKIDTANEPEAGADFLSVSTPAEQSVSGA